MVGARLVREKFPGFTRFAAAVTVYGPPAVVFAVNGADATPNAFVATVIVAVLLLNTPDAPDPGAVNVTFTPEPGLLPASFTVTASAFAKAVLIVADCGVVPAFAVIVVAAPTVFVSEKFTGVNPVAAAVTVYGPPAVAFAVNGVAATPTASVPTRLDAVLLLNTPEAPAPGAVNVTFTPETGLLPASFTFFFFFIERAATKTSTLPLHAALPIFVEAAPPVFVSEKFTGVNPVAAAVTVYGPPAVVFAVNGADATHDAFVATVIVAVLLLNTPEAPDPGAVNVTFTPETGLLPASFTVTASAFAKAVLIVADCGVVPAFAVIVVAGTAEFVSEQLTRVHPVAAAVPVYGPPAVVFAVNGADATPFFLMIRRPPRSTLLPSPTLFRSGAVNVTFTPETGLLPASFTVTASAFAKAVLIVADCGVVPAFAVIVVA